MHTQQNGVNLKKDDLNVMLHLKQDNTEHRNLDYSTLGQAVTKLTLFSMTSILNALLPYMNLGHLLISAYLLTTFFTGFALQISQM